MNSDLYNKIVFNESVYNREIGYKVGYLMKMKMNIYTMLLVLQVFISKIKIKRSKADLIHYELGVSWNNLHHKKIRSIKNNVSILNINNKDMLKGQDDFSKLSIFRAWSFALKNKRKTTLTHTYDSFFYKIYLYLLYDFLYLKLNKVKKIYISGHFDRVVSIISEINETNGSQLNLIQHGCIQVFNNKLKKNKVNGNIYYNNKFSVPYFSSFLEISKIKNFIGLKESNPEITYFHDSLSKIIAFGCQDAKPENNLKIIKFLLENYKSKLIYVIPHPKEKQSYYFKKLKGCNVFISRKKPVNIELFISRFSTLGIEYYKCGVNSIFINIDKVKMDFMFSNDFKVYGSLKDFKEEVFGN